MPSGLRVRLFHYICTCGRTGASEAGEGRVKLAPIDIAEGCDLDCICYRIDKKEMARHS
jgi:hypothetical protein